MNHRSKLADFGFRFIALATLFIASIAGAATSGLTLSATAQNQSSISLSWTPSTQQNTYSVERSASSAGPFVILTETRKGAQTYTDSALPASTTFYYRVRGVTQKGKTTTYSSYSNVASAKTLAPYTPPPPPPPPIISADKVLVVYNVNSAESMEIAAYYLANRPEFSTANVLGVATDDAEGVAQDVFSSTIRQPIVNWMQANPAKPIYYIVLLRGIPSRVWGTSSVDYQMGSALSDLGIRSGAVYGNSAEKPYVPAAYPGTTALVTHLNMGSQEATIAYIDKLKAMYLAMPTPNVVISASASGRAGTHYLFDEAQGFYGYSVLMGDANQLTSEGVAGSRITYSPQSTADHIWTGANVLGYETWGANGGLGGDYANDGKVMFTGASSWYLIKTLESFNGQWYTGQGNFADWFSSNAFGGVNYSNTPAGATSHVEEPLLSGVASGAYLADWEKGLLFAEAAWDSRNTPYFMAVGDPLIVR